MRTRSTVTKSRGLVRVRIELPTNAENVSLGSCFSDVRPREMRAWLQGSGGQSVTWNLRHATNRNAAGTDILASDQATTTITTPDILTPPFDVVTIPDLDFVWLITSAQAGTVAEFNMVMRHAGIL